MKIKKPSIVVDNQPITDIYTLLDDARDEDISIKEVEIKNIRMIGEDLSKVEFKNVIFDNCRMTECDFTRATISMCPLRELEVSECRFVETNFFKTRLKELDLIETKIRTLEFCPAPKRGALRWQINLLCNSSPI